MITTLLLMLTVHGSNQGGLPAHYHASRVTWAGATPLSMG